VKGEKPEGANKYKTLTRGRGYTGGILPWLRVLFSRVWRLCRG